MVGNMRSVKTWSPGFEPHSCQTHFHFFDHTLCGSPNPIVHLVTDTFYLDALKVHKIENFFGFDFEFYTVSLLVMLKYEGFVTKMF